MALVATHDFEEGQDGRLLTLGNGITLINGTPIYRSEASVKGLIGIRSPLPGGTFQYALANGSGIGFSFYIIPRIPSTGASTDLLILRGPGAERVGALRMKSAGKFDLSDTADANVDTSNVEWIPHQPMRFDCKVNFAIGSVHWECAIYAGGDIDNNFEGATDITLQGTWTSSHPFAFITFGDQTPGSEVDFDYIRLYDQYQFPDDADVLPSPDWNRVPVYWGPADFIDGTIPKGQIKFKPNVYRFLDDDAVTPRLILGKEVVAQIEPDGIARVYLPATDDLDITPNGFVYMVTEQVQGMPEQNYTIEVPLTFKDVGLYLQRININGAGMGDAATIVTRDEFLNLQFNAVRCNYFNTDSGSWPLRPAGIAPVIYFGGSLLNPPLDLTGSDAWFKDADGGDEGGGESGTSWIVTSKTANYTAGDHELVICDVTTGQFTITLPSPAMGLIVQVKKIDASLFTVRVIDPIGGQIDNLSEDLIGTRNQCQTYLSSDTHWYRV